MDYNELIERERLRRNLLVQKLEETDRRIALLMTLSKEGDPLDKWLDEQISAPVAKVDQAVTETKTPISVADLSESRLTSQRPMRDTPKKMSSQWIDLIDYLGLEGKGFAEVESFMALDGSPMTPGSIRTGLMNYRKDYGLVSNPKPGFYCATEKGLAFVSERKRSRGQT